MDDSNLEDIDDWWKFKMRMNDFNSVRKIRMKSSHILVYDESMSAFIPRHVYQMINFIFYFISN